jgi:hypothetical protein
VIQFFKDFLWNKQSASSALGDLSAVAVVALASPAGTEYLGSLGAWGPMIAAGAAYLAGAVSGRKTGL